MTRATFILITVIIAAGVALSGIGAQIGDHTMSLIGSGVAAVGAIAWFAKSWRRKARLRRAGDRAAGGFLAFSVVFLFVGVAAAAFLDGATSNWVQAFGLFMAIVSTVLFAVYAANSDRVIDIEATAREQQAQNLRSRLADARNRDSQPETDKA